MKKLLVILLVLGMVAPAMAAEWNMYGSARIKFFYNDFDKDASNVQDNNGVAEDDADLDMGLQTNARIGANVKASDVVSGRFEYGTSGGNANIRLLYGVWNFGSGSFLVGQDYTPVDTLYSNQVVLDDNGLLSEGMVYEGRKPQLKLKMGGFQAALISPTLPSGFVPGMSDVDSVIPKIELAYDMKMDMMSFGGYVGYQTYTGGQSGADFDVNSWVGGVRGKFEFGPAYVNANVFYAQNARNYGIGLRNVFAGDQAVGGTTGTDTEDATTFAGALAIGAKFTDMLAIEAGVGYMKNERDNFGTGTSEGDATTYYVQLPITLAPGVFIVPEVSVFDLGEDDDGVAGTPNADNGQAVYYGAKFQINF